MKIVYFFILTTFIGCSSYKNIELVHDYIIDKAYRICKSHQGFHYIASKTNWKPNVNTDSYPCEQTYVASCQDGYQEEFGNGIAHCFISKLQIDDVINTLSIK